MQGAFAPYAAGPGLPILPPSMGYQKSSFVQQQQQQQRMEVTVPVPEARVSCRCLLATYMDNTNAHAKG
jgi:hypothetical protein